MLWYDSGENQGLFQVYIMYTDNDHIDDVLCCVLYEDGDTEDMNEVECRESVDLYVYMKLESV